MKSRPLSFTEACARFPHRYTVDHIPAHVRHRQPNGLFLAPQYASDGEWYEKTLFAGESPLANSRYCHSDGQSWPFGQWLDVQPSRELFNRLQACREA